MSIVAWILLGLVAGLLAKSLVPGEERIGIVLTTALGIVGALLGGLVASALGLGNPIDEFFDLSTWLSAVLGAMAILFAFRALRD